MAIALLAVMVNRCVDECVVHLLTTLRYSVWKM